MRRRNYYVVIMLLLAEGCGQRKQPQRVDKIQETPSAIVETSVNVIDYKKGKYHFFIGQDKDSVDKIIDLKHNYLADDGVIDDDGVTHYMNIGEDLINLPSEEEVLPALFFATNKKKLTAFSCSIVCALYDNKKVTIASSLDRFVPYFSALKEGGNRKKLVNSLSLVIHNPNFREEFKIDTVGQKYQFIFSYEKSLRQSDK